MVALKLYVTPKAGASGFFEGITWLGGRRALLCVSRTPLLDAARGLVGGGYDPATVLEMWHPEAATWSLRAPIGEAAKLRVAEGEKRPQFRPWTAFSPGQVPPPASQSGEGPTQPPETSSVRER